MTLRSTMTSRVAPVSLRPPTSRRRPDPRRDPGRAGGRALVGRLRPRARPADLLAGDPDEHALRRSSMTAPSSATSRRPRRTSPTSATPASTCSCGPTPRSRSRSRRHPDARRHLIDDRGHHRHDDRSGRRQRPRDRGLREARLPSRRGHAALPADAGWALGRRACSWTCWPKNWCAEAVAHCTRGLSAHDPCVRMGSTRGRRDATDPNRSEGGIQPHDRSHTSDPTTGSVRRRHPCRHPPALRGPAPAGPAASGPRAHAGAPRPAAARPTGITILAVLAAIGGVFGLLGGFGVLFVGGDRLVRRRGASSACARSRYAALLIAFAWGAWTLKPWAWPLGVAVADASASSWRSCRSILGGVSHLQPDHQHRDRRRDPVLPEPARDQVAVRTRLSRPNGRSDVAVRPDPPRRFVSPVRTAARGSPASPGTGRGTGRAASSASVRRTVARDLDPRQQPARASRRDRRRAPSRIALDARDLVRLERRPAPAPQHRPQLRAPSRSSTPWSTPIDVLPAVDRQDVAALAVGVVHRPRRGPPSGAAAGRPRRPWRRRRRPGRRRRTPGPSPRRTGRRAGSSAARSPSRSPPTTCQAATSRRVSVPSGKSSSGRSPSVGL